MNFNFPECLMLPNVIYNILDLVDDVIVYTQQRFHNAEHFTNQSVEVIQEFTRQALDDCKKTCYTHFAGHENIAREKKIGQLQIAVESIKTNFGDFCQQVSTDSNECVDSLDNLAKELDEIRINTRCSTSLQNALAVHQTSFDILSVALNTLSSSNQDILNQVSNCQETIKNEKTTMFSKGLYRITPGTIRLPLLHFILKKTTSIAVYLDKVPFLVASMIASITCISATLQIFYQIYLGNKASNDLKHLSDVLEEFKCGSTDILHLLGKACRLIYTKEELKQNIKSETKTAVENKIKSILKEACVVADAYKKQNH